MAMFNWRSFLPFILTLGFSPLIDDFAGTVSAIYVGERVVIWIGGIEAPDDQAGSRIDHGKWHVVECSRKRTASPRDR